jgi:hypothetical protein
LHTQYLSIYLFSLNRFASKIVRQQKLLVKCVEIPLVCLSSSSQNNSMKISQKLS